MAAREVKMIVARYFSTIRHQIPPSARIGRLGLLCPELFRLFQSTTTEFERPSWLAHWGINSDHPLKSLAKSIAFVSRKKDTTRKKSRIAVARVGSPRPVVVGHQKGDPCAHVRISVRILH